MLQVELWLISEFMLWSKRIMSIIPKNQGYCNVLTLNNSSILMYWIRMISPEAICFLRKITLRCKILKISEKAVNSYYEFRLLKFSESEVLDSLLLCSDDFIKLFQDCQITCKITKIADFWVFSFWNPEAGSLFQCWEALVVLMIFHLSLL